jgi:hypothetical protein
MNIMPLVILANLAFPIELREISSSIPTSCLVLFFIGAQTPERLTICFVRAKLKLKLIK